MRNNTESTRRTSLHTNQGGCERGEEPPLPLVATALHRGPPRHCTLTTDSIYTDEFIHYFLIPMVILFLSSPLSLSVNFKNPCFIYTVKGNNPPIYT
jgi:hypothetical protein